MSKSKIVTYDLRNPGRNYNALYEYFQSYSVWAHIAESAWFISTEKDCSTVRDEIKNLVDSNDCIFVAELTGVGAWRNVICDPNYLMKNL